MSIKVLSIFSGGGGIDCGFKNAGYDICFSTDFWKPACDTLELNKVGRLVRCADIRKVDYGAELAKIDLSVSDIDVLVGGPPCPAYSKSRFSADRHVLLTQNLDFIGRTKKERLRMKIPLRFMNILER